MFCLFRNAQIEPSLNRYVILLSLLGVASWLYFSFIEKSLVGKVLSGEALIVDLVFGLPLVLMLAVVVYASIYWACKLLIILLLPQAITMKSDESQALDNEMEDEQINDLEAQHGEGYWQKSEQENASSESLNEQDKTTDNPENKESNSDKTQPPKQL